MTTLLFVHGTGVREGYHGELELVREQVRRYLPQVTVASCYWAGEHATALHHGGRSIPSGRARVAVQDSDDDLVLLWASLYRDPLFELRLLALAPCPHPGDVPRDRFVELLALRLAAEQFKITPELRSLLERGDIAASFDLSRSDVVSGAPFDAVLRSATQPIDEVRAALARAIVARAIRLMRDAGNDPQVQCDADLRDQTVAEVTQGLGNTGGARPLPAWAATPLRGMLEHMSTYFLRRYHYALTDFAFPFASDILLYQRDGEPIRNFIQCRINEAIAPVVLLAHSFGGIACFDLLTLPNAPQVAGLITVGSQSPLLYELDVLAGLRFSQSLPATFPRWLNIYDLRDILSFVAEPVFLSRGSAPANHISDLLVNNRQPFPQAHISYWTNRQVWESIVDWFRELS